MRGLVDAWEDSRQERTGMRHGERVASIEHAIEGSMRPSRVLDWLLDRADPEHDQPEQTEPEHSDLEHDEAEAEAER